MGQFTSTQQFTQRSALLTEAAKAMMNVQTGSRDFIPVATKNNLLKNGVAMKVASQATTPSASFDSGTNTASALKTAAGTKSRVRLSADQVNNLKNSVTNSKGGSGNRGSSSIVPDYNMQLSALRYGFLPNDTDILNMRSMGPRNWLIKQLSVRNFDFGSRTFPTMAAQIRLFQSLGSAPGGWTPERRQLVCDQYLRDSRTYLRKVALSEKPFLNRYLQFLENYFGTAFKVSLGDPSTYELGLQGHAFFEEVIVANGLGSFGNLLNKVARSPAMLMNLNGVDSKKGSNPLQNYPRELLELHTISAESQHYTLSNIETMSRMLTGMRFSRLTSDVANPWGQIGGEYFFSGQEHDTGPKNFDFLNIHFDDYSTDAYSGDKKITQVLNALAEHPDTAKNFATRLVKHFFSDLTWAGTAAIIGRLAKVFLQTKGDLNAVLQAMVMDIASLHPTPFKAMQPFGLMVGMLRSAGLVTAQGDANEDDLLNRIITNYLPSMNQPLKEPPTVQGFLPDDAIWVNAASIMQIYDVVSAMAIEVSAKISAQTLYTNVVGALAKGMYTTPTTKIPTFADNEPINAIICIYMSPEILKRG